MNQKLFENAHKNTTIYDGVHEYCTVEHVNEAFFRASIRKRRRSILKKILQVFLCTTKQEKDKLHDESSNKEIVIDFLQLN